MMATYCRWLLRSVRHGVDVSVDHYLANTLRTTVRKSSDYRYIQAPLHPGTLKAQ